MSDNPPQFSESAPHRQFRPKFPLSSDAFEDGASVQEPAIEANGVSPQREVPDVGPPWPNQLEDKQTPPPFFPLYKQRTQPLPSVTLKQQEGQEEKWSAGRNRLWESEAFSFDVVDDESDIEKKTTYPLPVFKGRIPDLQNRPMSAVQYADDLDFQDRATIPMAVLKGISERQGQPTPVMHSEISGAASNAALIGLGNIAGNIFKYGNNLLIQRGFGVGPYGLYTLGSSIVTLFVAVFNLGLDDAMVRYVSIYRSKKQDNLLRGLTFFCTILAAIGGLLGGLLMLFLAPLLASLRHTPNVIPILLLMAPLIPLMSVQQLWSSGLQGFKAFKNRVFLQRFVIPGLLTVLLIVVLIFFHSITAVVIATILSIVVSAALNLQFFLRLVSRLKSKGAREYDIREWSGFAIPNFFTSVVDTALDATDTLLLAFFVFSSADLGRYAAANKISNFIVVPLLTLNVTFAPTIAELFSKGEKQALAIMFQIVTKWIITFSLPICIIAMLFSRSLLSISGQSFVDAWPLLLALSVGNMLNAGTGPVGYMLNMTGHQKLTFLNSLTAIVVNIVLGIILTPHYGAMGTAIATGLALAVVNLMRLLQVRLLLKLHPYRWDTFKPIGAGLISALLTGMLLFPVSVIGLHVELFNKNLPLQLALIPVFLACYAVLLVLFKVSPEDKIVLEKLRKKLVHGKNKKEV